MWTENVDHTCGPTIWTETCSPASPSKRETCSPTSLNRLRCASQVQRRPFSKDEAAPEWLQRYLVAKRAVEAELAASTGSLRPVIVRPSLIWDWKKLDVLPIIPVFNLASALGVPFVDRTIRVGTLADAIVAGVAGDAEGVQRFAAMDELALEARA